MMKRAFRQPEDDHSLPPAKQSKSVAPRRGVYMCVWERKKETKRKLDVNDDN